MSRVDQLRASRTASPAARGDERHRRPHDAGGARHLGADRRRAAAVLALKIAGAVYLLWLAWQAIPGRRPAARRPRRRSSRRFWQSYLTGVGINLLNPKVVLFFVTFLPQFVDAHDPAATGKLFFLGAEFIVISIPLMVADRATSRS